MRIAFIVGEFPKLSETFILSQITGLLDMGHDVSIFAGVRLKEPKVHPCVYKYSLLDRTYYPEDFIPKSIFKRISKAFYYLLLERRNGNYSKMLKTVNIFKYRKKALGFTYLFYLVHFLKNNFDVIHAHFGPNGLRTLFLKEILGTKLITSFHGYDFSYYVKKNGNKIYKDLFRKGDVFTYNSTFTRSKLLQLGCPNKSLVKLPMGIKLNDFIFDEKQLLANDAVNVVSVGRLIEKKGYEYAIKALAKIIEKYHNVSYRIAGDGPLRERLLHLIKDLKAEHNIKLLGPMKAEEIRNLYKISSIFLQPSVEVSDGNTEGQGVVLLEAQACGLPVIATRHNGFPESLIEGKSGFLVPERDDNAIVERLTHLIENPQIWPEMGRTGRKFIEDNFDIKKLNEQLVYIYKNN